MKDYINPLQSRTTHVQKGGWGIVGPGVPLGVSVYFFYFNLKLLQNIVNIFPCSFHLGNPFFHPPFSHLVCPFFPYSTPQGGPWVNFCRECDAGISEPLPHNILFWFILWPFIDPILVTFIQMISLLLESSQSEIPF